MGLFAQNKEANNWFWGERAGLNFYSTPPKVILNSKLWSNWSSSSISDSAGRWLFATDGDSIWRKNGQTLWRKPLYRKIMGLPYTQPFDSLGLILGSLIIPNPINTQRFWVILWQASQPVKPKLNDQYIAYQVDLTLDNGKGDLDSNSVVRFYQKGDGCMAVMRHLNENSNWLVGRRYNTDTLLAWKIDSIIHTEPVISKIESPYYRYEGGSNAVQNWNNYPRTCKSSPNSQILFWDWAQRETRFSQLIKFNQATGEFYDRIHLIDSLTLKPKNTDYRFGIDAAFSPDSRYLYTIENTYKFNVDSTPVSVQQQNRRYYTIRQYDLSVWDSAAIKNSGRVVFQSGPIPSSGLNGVGSMTCQLGPDGKIYFQEFLSTRLSVMHCPNSPAPNVNFKFREINLQRRGGYRMPTLNQTFVRNAGIFQVQANKRKLCKGDTLELSGYGAGAEHFTWIVSPALPVSVKVDTLTWQKISTTTIPAGSYTFTCQSFSRCGDVLEKSIVVEILPLPVRPNLSLIQKPVPCLGDSVIIRLQTPVSGNRYFWSTGDSTSSIVVKQTGLYSLDSVSNTFGCGIRVGDTVGVTIKNVPIPLVPVIVGPKLVEVCEGQVAKLKVETQNAKVVWSIGVVGDSITVGSGQYSAISKTAEGCQSGVSDTIKVVEVPLPVVQIVAMDSVRCESNQEEKEYKVKGQHVEVKSFEIQGGELVSQTDTTVTVRWFANEVQSQNVKIKSFNRIGCEGTTAVFRPKTDLEVCRSLYPLGIPNLVTLNGNGKNDLWELVNLFYFQPVSLHIYNRWGKLIFETSDYRNNWPEQGLEPGTYFYRMFMAGKAQSGWVEVVK